MLIENVCVFGWLPALRGMRNPKNSWDKSDTVFHDMACTMAGLHGIATNVEQVTIGPNDLKLMLGLVKAGSAHRKFLRQIGIWVDVTGPRWFWQEIDTYKVATVRNSCSTMHKLGSRDLTEADFEASDVHPVILAELNAMGACYRADGVWIDPNVDGLTRGYDGKFLLEHMKNRLPEGFLQKSTYSMSYETALNMYGDRHAHRMPQWSGPGGICEWIKTLPYMAQIIGVAEGRS